MSKIFKVSRPIVFLCGPNYQRENALDRRNLLYTYIADLARKRNKIIKFQIIPVIVDDLFPEEYAIDNNLSYKFMEEIVASISFNTYIYLDTMSTSYELGLFDNSYGNLKPKIFVEPNYDKRKKNFIGDYIKLSVGTNRFFVYDGKRTLIKQYVRFKNNKKLPDEIKEVIKEDENVLYRELSKGFAFSFIENSELRSDEIGNVFYSYDQDSNKLVFDIDVKTFFYFLTNLFSKSEVSSYCKKKSYYGAYLKIVNEVFIHFCNNKANSKINITKLLTFKPKIIINIGKFSKSLDVVKYCLLIIDRINDDLTKRNYQSRTINVSRKVIASKDIFKSISKDYFSNLFNFDKAEFKIIKNYDYYESLATVKSMISIKGKTRTIITYAHNREGELLRSVHEKISNLLFDHYEFSNGSFAYKKESSTKLCISQHLHSNSFVKLDISNFFNSIELSLLAECLRQELLKTTFSPFRRFVPFLTKFFDFFSCCTFEEKVPLGFVTSPILSDVYLKELDKTVINSSQNIIYTRYADDILLSSEDINYDFSELEGLIYYLLHKRSLVLNSKKRITKKLINVGDSVHYLGINIVKSISSNRLTISKNNLLGLAEKIRLSFSFIQGHKELVDYDTYYSILSYVKNISSDSFDKLTKICKIRHNIDIKI